MTDNKKNTRQNASVNNEAPAWFTQWGAKLDDMAKSLEGINSKLAKLGNLEAKVKKQEKEIITLKSTVAYLDKKIREKNLLIHGINWNKPEFKDMTWEERAMKWFLTALGVIVRVDAAYSMGKKKPFFVSLATVSERNKIFRSEILSKLKGTKVSIQDDLPLEIRKARKEWMPTMIYLKNAGHKVYFRDDKLYSDNQLVKKNPIKSPKKENCLKRKRKKKNLMVTVWMRVKKQHRK